MAEQGGLGGEPGAHPPPSLPDMLLHAEWASHACHRQLPLARPVGARLCLAFRNSAPCRRALVLQELYVLSSVRPRQVSFLVPTPPCLTLPRLVGWGGPAFNGWRCPSAVGSFRPRSRCTSTRGSGQLPYLLTLSLEQSLWTICRPDTRRCPEQASWFLKHGVSPFCHSVTYLTRPARRPREGPWVMRAGGSVISRGSHTRQLPCCRPSEQFVFLMKQTLPSPSH